MNGLLIFIFAALAVRAAMGRQFATHERWAIRLFLVSNAQWFLRIGGFGYFTVMTSLGHDVPFDGGFFKFWVWGCFLVPLAFAQLYFWSRHSTNRPWKILSVSLFIAAIIATLVGTAVFSLFLVQLSQGSVGA